MEIDLQYVVAHVAPYSVATASRLCYLGADLAEMATDKQSAVNLVRTCGSLRMRDASSTSITLF